MEPDHELGTVVTLVRDFVPPMAIINSPEAPAVAEPEAIDEAEAAEALFDASTVTVVVVEVNSINVIAVRLTLLLNDHVLEDWDGALWYLYKYVVT